MMKKLLLTFCFTFLLLVQTALPASAKSLADDKVVAGGEYTLEEGETLEGNLVVLGGSVTLEAGSEVAGSIIIVGGITELGGEVAEDVVVFGGNVSLLETVVIQGDLVRSGGSIEAEEGYEVQGNETQSIPTPPVLPFDNNSEFSAPEVPTPFTPIRDGIEGMIAFILSLIVGVIQAVSLAVLGAMLTMFVAAFMPEPLSRVTAAMTQAPVLSVGFGMLTLIAVPVLAGVLALVTLLCLSPVSLLAMVVYVTAIFFGWLALGTLVGEKLLGTLRNQTMSTVLAAGLGTFLLTLLVNLFNVLPVVGEFFSAVSTFLLASFGLGAVVLTRFGLRPYIPNIYPAQPAAPAAPPTAEA